VHRVRNVDMSVGFFLRKGGDVTQQFKIRTIVGIVVLVATITTLIDQVTKWAVLQLLNPGEQVEVIRGFFSLTLLFNKGAAFGLFAGIESDALRYTLLGLSTLVALSVLGYVLLRDFCEDVPGQCVVGTVLGGAVGNIIDRVRLGEVIDFLDFYLGSHHWPAFNVADSAICVGVILLLLRKPRCTPDCLVSSSEKILS
jgi:signal peptidase II